MMWRRRKITPADANEIQIQETLMASRVMVGMTRAQVAEKTGWTVDQIIAFERCETDPTLATVRRYCHAIGVLSRWGVTIKKTMETPPDDEA